MGSFLFLSLFRKVQGNWCDCAYPSAIVFLSWTFCEGRTRLFRWMPIGAAVAALLIIPIVMIPVAQEKGFGNIPYKWNPFRHNMGWEGISKALEDHGYDVEKNFLFSSKYQMSSILSFYGPEQKRAYFFNIHHIRRNQFSFWPGMKENEGGKDGYYIIIENEPYLSQHMGQIGKYVQELSPYFVHVEFVTMVPLFEANGQVTKGAMIFKGVGYNGKVPDEVDRW
jgi:hypothetical protein